MNLKNPDLDLIRRIHPECGFYGLIIRYWICPKKRKIRFWIRKSGFGFSQKNPPKVNTHCYHGNRSILVLLSTKIKDYDYVSPGS